MLAQHGHGLVQLILGNGIGTGEDNGGSSLNLVIVELTEILGVDLHLTGIGNSHGITQLHILHLLHGSNHIRQLANAGGFDNHPVGVILGNHLLQSLTEVTHQAAADAAGVHLGNIDAGLLQETAVNADLTKFIFNQHQLLAAVTFRNHFLDQCGLTGSQKAGINIDFCHWIHLLYCFYFIPVIIAPEK